MNLTAARELNKQEEAQQQLHLWAAILATHDALIAGGLTGLPAVHVERAKAALLRAGDKERATTQTRNCARSLSQAAHASGLRSTTATRSSATKP